MGKIALILTDRPAQPWKAHLLKADPKLEIGVWPDMDDYEAYDTAVVWKHPAGLLKNFKNLKLIYSLGAGVDHILSDPDLPSNIKVARVVDTQLTQSMSNFIIMAVLNYQRRLSGYLQFRAEGRWQKLSPTENPLHIGLLGLGELGSDAAKKLAMLGFDVHGFSRSPKKMDGVQTYHGEAGLDYMLSQVNMLVILLPLTSETKGMLNTSFFDKCQAGTYLINVARGQHLVESDLLQALDHGRISGAWLDVFQQEPLPEDHPFWQDPRILITPHIASVTNPASAAAQIAENHQRLLRNETLLHTIDMTKEY